MEFAEGKQSSVW